MEEVTKRVVQLEKDTHQIRLDVATLTERSKNFATRTSVDQLIERCATFVTRAEFNGKLHDFEVRLNARLDRMDSRINEQFRQMHIDHMAMIERLDTRITLTEARTHTTDSKIFWGIFLPGMTAAIGWFFHTVVMV